MRDGDDRADTDPIVFVRRILCTILTGNSNISRDATAACLLSFAENLDTLSTNRCVRWFRRTHRACKSCLAPCRRIAPRANSVAIIVRTTSKSQEQAKLQAERQTAIAAQARAEAEGSAAETLNDVRKRTEDKVVNGWHCFPVWLL